MAKKEDDFSIFHKIAKFFSEPGWDSSKSLKEAQNYLDNAISKGYNPISKNYFLFCSLIQAEGIGRSKIYQLLKRIAEHPKFVLKDDKEHFPTETVMSYLAGASYWLDKDLFNDKAIFKEYNCSKNTSSENDLITLLDIGCILLNKGFKFPNMANIRNPEITHYMKVYIDMVNRRNKFKKKGYVRLAKQQPKQISIQHERKSLSR